METFVTVVAHSLGLLGMAGVWLVPLRIFQLLLHRRVEYSLQRDKRSLVLTIAVSAAIAFSVYVGVDTLPRVFRCLWEGWCTATRGGGLLHLAFFGATVALLETVRYLSSALARRWHRNAGR